ncbi:hypothetical protein KKG05_06440 [bacterium]|nr:hypothetical protein [bacterium]
MSELMYALVCEKALLDRWTDHVSAINIISGFRVMKLPVILGIPFTIITEWSNEKEVKTTKKLMTRIDILTPSQKTKAGNALTELNPKQGIHRIFNNINSIPLDEHGIHHFVIMQGEEDSLEKKGFIPFNVIVLITEQEEIFKPSDSNGDQEAHNATQAEEQA